MKTIKQYEKEILKTIQDKNIFTIEMIFSFYSGISRANFYKLGLNKLDTLKKALDDNKNRTKQSMLNKWYKSDNPTLQMGLMKIICTEDEAHRLNGSKTESKNETTHKGKIDINPIEWT